MVFCIFIFILLFRTNGWKEHLDGNNFRHSFNNYFDSAILKVTWSHWHRFLKDNLQLKILLRWVNIRANSFLGEYHETKINADVRKIISCTKLRGCSSKNIAPRHFTHYCILLFFQKNLVSKFNLVLIEWFSPQFIWLYTFWYSVLKFIQWLYAFFNKNQ